MENINQEKPDKRTVNVALRLPAPFYECIKEAADTETRSINAQIIHALRQVFDPVLLSRKKQL